MVNAFLWLKLITLDLKNQFFRDCNTLTAEKIDKFYIKWLISNELRIMDFENEKQHWNLALFFIFKINNSTLNCLIITHANLTM